MRHHRAQQRAIGSFVAATLTLLAACADDGRDAETGLVYEDVEIDTITAPPASARGAQEYLQSGEGVAEGEPLRIAWLNESHDWNVSLRAATELVNRELDGVRGRPIEILSCGTAEPILQCAERVKDLEPVLALIGKTDTRHRHLRQALADIPAVTVEPEDPEAWNDPFTHHFTLGSVGVLRAAATWAAALPPEKSHNSILVLAPYAEALEGTLDELEGTPVSALVLAGDEARNAEGVIADALERLGAKPDGRTLIVNALEQDGCVSLARAVDPRVADPAWGDIEVVTTGACAGKKVHDELGDWPPEWYHVGAGPDLQTYELDPQVRVYRDRITRYGGPSADWTATNSLPFAALLTILRILTPILADTTETTHDDVNEAIASYTGPGYMGMPEHRCGFDPARTSLCVRHARMFLYTGQRDWRNIVGEPFLLKD